MLDYNETQSYFQSETEATSDLPSVKFDSFRINMASDQAYIGVVADRKPVDRMLLPVPNLHNYHKLTFFDVQEILNQLGIEEIGCIDEVDEMIGGIGATEKAKFAIYYDPKARIAEFDLGNSITDTALAVEILAIRKGIKNPIKLVQKDIRLQYDPVLGEWTTADDNPEELAYVACDCLRDIQEFSIFRFNTNIN